MGLRIDLTSGYGREVLGGVLEYVNQSDRWTVIGPFVLAIGLNVELRAPHVDGILAMVDHDHIRAEIERTGLPAVNVADVARGGPGMPAVIPDDAAIGRLAAEHLLARGFAHFAYLAYGSTWSVERGKAFAIALADAGKAPPNVYEGQEVLPTAWLASLPKQTAVFAASDWLAWRVLEGCRRARIAVPEDVAVLGVDDDPLIVQVTRPALSSINTRNERVGYRAAQLLDDLMDGAPPPPGPLLIEPAGVTTRGSTDVLAVADTLVAAALRLIRQRAPRGFRWMTCRRRWGARGGCWSGGSA